ncbi:phosphoenolpyruvate--protein phosphotransferase [Sinanaerobacter chloroacetimidivorans]|uniref:phosphoenolpyruvate--protein phosphotransferase n=1 Tax=Sinanaerobacter chloroacetimidivorans TaxID=2818044 RepID=UPI001D05A0EE|nr:phosphoenolpyruvate--protein phosphotransferase [Sinanaerobacter chloroacetimidivorans]
MTVVYSGIAGSEGIAAGKAYVFINNQTEIDMEAVASDAIQTELEKLNEGIELSRTQLIRLKEKVLQEFDESKAQIFEAHRMMLEDPEFAGAIREAITSGSVNAAYAVKKVADSYIAIFEQIEDDYMRERAADIKDVSSRLTRNILGISSWDLLAINSPVIIVAHDLTPSDTAMMNKEYVLGFTTDVGGSTSHTAIMARSLGIPAVLGLGDISSRIKDGDYLIIDGFEGKIIVNPDQEQQAEYEMKISQHRERRKKLQEVASLPAITADGRRIEISCNIGTPEDIHGAAANGGDGIGLFRTEFLYMNSNSLPSEEEQYEQYRKAAVLLQGKPLIIRTLDIGGDKKLPYLRIPEEMNPFLGWRAIRICLERKDIFKTQLRAILRASTEGNILIMFPMISGVGEVREAKKVLEETKEELRRENIKFDENIRVGIMVEIPSAAMTADIIAKEVDFFSIGTNDLCQYALAVDRMNPKVSSLYQPLHPGILRLIKNVIDASHRYGKFTGMCGEMAGTEEACVILLGLGLDEFSMSAAAIPAIKNLVRSVTIKQAEEIADHALTMDTPEEVLEYSRNILNQINKGLLCS